MANAILTPEVIAKEALMVLSNNLVMAELVHRDFDPEFVGAGDTITIRKPAKFQAKRFQGTTETQDIQEGSVAVKLDRLRDVTVAVDSKQLSLDIADFSAQVVEPAMRAIAQAIDEDLLSYACQAAKDRFDANPEAKDLADIAQLAKHLDLQKAPVQDRSLVMHPEHKYRYALAENLSNASYAGTNETLREALLGKLYTLNTYMDQNVPGSIAAAPGTARSATVTGTKGEDTVSVTADGTLAVGDGLVIGGTMYRITDQSGSACTLDKKLEKDASEEAALVGNKPYSLAFHRGALALVTRSLALPMGAAQAGYASAGGLGVRVVYDYDAATKTDKISFDILYGIQLLDEALICTLAG